MLNLKEKELYNKLKDFYGKEKGSKELSVAKSSK